MSAQGRVLFIDAYDSFSNNIITLLKNDLGVKVEVIKIDDSRFIHDDEAFIDLLRGFEAVVAGPGPGHPSNPDDAGLIAKLWQLPEDHILPVLGICLGFQSLCLSFGAVVERLQEPRHGLVTKIDHCRGGVFANTGDIEVTQYHSLRVKLEPDSTTARQNEDRWRASESCEHLLPLAWDTTQPVDGPILMGARHCSLPFWGVQYHPESICTSEEGRKIILRWWHKVLAWRSSKSGARSGFDKPSLPGEIEYSSPRSPSPDVGARSVQWRSIRKPVALDTAAVMDHVRQWMASGVEPMLLESGSKNGRLVNAETGRYSIIGVPDAQSVHIRYSTNTQVLHVTAGDESLMELKASITDVFTFLEEWMKDHKADGGPENVPFWGGLVGFISYEAGLETIDVQPSRTTRAQPDIWFVFVQRSIVVDHVNRVTYLQSARGADDDWLKLMESSLSLGRGGRNACSIVNSPSKISADVQAVSSPRKDEYEAKVLQCQSHLRAGSSYELCLTDTTHIRTDKDAWSLYKRLRTLNPAPFAAYLCMEGSDSTPDISIISSSPERFLSWSRDGSCQFRPIKGTLKKTDGVDRAVAEKVLSSSKERAENLMIVDLIRHDLSGVQGVSNVTVPKLMSIEEYETVFQLTSIIEGDAENGIAVLAASLPPGSMTGAPKKRSCDLLKSVEREAPRGLYSGVFGYFDVGGGGDFSVMIRSAFKWGDREEWHVGAGGAVTVLSTAEGEWEEMLAKRASVLQAFS